MLESFLSKRKQCVKNGIEYSNWVTINHGVPQGTVLGPLIFIMYINNFQRIFTVYQRISHYVFLMYINEKMKKEFYSLQMTHALFVIPIPMKINYAKLTVYWKILTVI